MHGLTDTQEVGAPPEAAGGDPIHILILTDRDWTHPQGGGTGTHLHEQVKFWLTWGHSVTVVAGGYPGALPVEREGNLTIKRIGSRTTVFPRVIIRGQKALAPNADVALEVINGITFLTPLWMDLPRLGVIHHIHKEHYVREMGGAGRFAAAALETIPLKTLYRDTAFLTVSDSTAEEISEHGIPREAIKVAHNGVDTSSLQPGLRADVPTILYLGRLKKYKRVEFLLDSLDLVPNAILEIAGDGDNREAIEVEVARRGLGDRVRLHGFVTEEEKVELLQRAWLNVTASSVEGWSLVALESAACSTPTVAMRVGGLREAVVDHETGLLSDTREQLAANVARLLLDDDLRTEMGEAARVRSATFAWKRTATLTIEALREAIGAHTPSAKGGGVVGKLRG
ncbi:MAG: glycosyltransferase family 4 protein [Actinomycetes bacterium]